MWKLIPSESTCCTRSNVTAYHHFLGAAPTTIEQYQPTVQSAPQKIESLNRALSQHHGCPGATVNQIFVFFLPLSLSL